MEKKLLGEEVGGVLNLLYEMVPVWMTVDRSATIELHQSKRERMNADTSCAAISLSTSRRI
jgi:hypothetical protein